MRRRATRVATLACGALLCLGAGGPASAERRVLLAFDASGHRVHSVRDDASDGIEPTSRARKTAAVDPARAVAAGEAVLVWRDADGRVLSTARVPDPRLAHAPAGAARASVAPGGRVALERGAWQVRGPDEAVLLELRLPARAEPALAAEAWRLPLDAASIPERR